MSSTDFELGLRIKQLLHDHNLENPAQLQQVEEWTNHDYRMRLDAKFAGFLTELGLFQNGEAAKRASQRILEMYLEERFTGLDYRNFPAINPLPNEFKYHEPLIAGNIVFATMCEHHLVPIRGIATIAYRPESLLVGLNKLNQVLYFFAKRPQLQERLTQQVFVVLEHLLATKDIAVIIKAHHDCMNLSGIQNDITEHTTNRFGGVFNHDSLFQSRVTSA